MNSNPLILVFDTETTGLPSERSFTESSDPLAWPRILQLSYILYNPVTMEIVPVRSGQSYGDDIIKLDGLVSPTEKVPGQEIHGITADKSLAGISTKEAIDNFIQAFDQCTTLVAHNIQFDVNLVCSELKRLILNATGADREKYLEVYNKLMGITPETAPLIVDTMVLGTLVCDLWPYKFVRDSNGVVLLDANGEKQKEYFNRPRSPKSPNLEEAHIALFNQQPYGQLHNALVDVAVCLRVYMKLEPAYNVDICSPRNSTLGNAEICRIINAGEPKPYKIPKKMARPAGKGGKKRTYRNSRKNRKTKKRYSRK
jgi:DNA polymerase III epsilon subunit-like protein